MSNRVTIGPDHIKIRLSFHHRQILRLLAERGGQVPFHFNSPFAMPPNWPKDQPHPTDDQKRQVVVDSDNSIREMGEMGLVAIITRIGEGPDSVDLVLTDMGRNVIDQMGIVVKKSVVEVASKKQES